VERHRRGREPLFARCARASLARSASISQETTSGGRRLKEATTRSSATGSAYFGC